MRKNAILKEYLIYVYQKNHKYGEIRSNFDQKLWGQFYRYEFIYFFSWILTRIQDNFEEKTVSDPTMHLTDSFEFWTLFLGHTVYAIYIQNDKHDISHV